MKLKKFKVNLIIMILTFIIALICYSKYNAVNAATQTETYTSDDGKTVTATLTDNGKMTITGNGVIELELISKFSYTNIKEVTIITGITSIGNKAFQDCSSLTSITIPSSVTSIGESAFYYCTNLTSITIPNSVISIGQSAFWNCRNLTSVTIPNSVTSIGHYAFDTCSSLTSITIPNSVTSIGDSAFRNCRNLTSINVDSNNANYSSIGGVLFNKDKSVIIRYPEGKEETTYTIPNSVTSIEDRAFYRCESLTSITISNNVTSIGESAFGYCRSLISIIIPNSVTIIENFAFDTCENLTSITIANSVTSIGYRAFFQCSNLTSINVDSNNANYSSIGGVLFNKDKSVILKYPIEKKQTTYTIPNSVTSIGEEAFHSCRNLTSVTIPNSVTSIEKSAFWNCRNLTSVTIPNSVTSIGESAFDTCSSLASITIPNGVTSIERRTFAICSSLTSITIPNSVTSIGDNAFVTCSSLTSAIIPNSVTNIGIGAFENCDSLTIICKSGSTILQYAKDNNYEYEIDDGNPTISVNQQYVKKGINVPITFGDEENHWYGWNITRNAEVPSEWNTNLTYNFSVGNGGVLSYIFTDNGVYYIHAIDKVGNTSKMKITVDGNAPQISNVTGNSEEWVKNITLKVTATDDISGIDSYSFDGGTTWQTSNSKVFTENKSDVQIKVKDKAGNITTYNNIINITKVDSTAPTIDKVVTVPGNNYTEKIVKVTATDTLSGILEYSFDGGTTWQENNSKSYTENESGIQIQVKDNVGNISTYTNAINTNTLKITVKINNREIGNGEIINEGENAKIIIDSVNGVEAYKITKSFIKPSTWETQFDEILYNPNAKSFNKSFTGKGRHYIWAKDSNENITVFLVNVEEDIEEVQKGDINSDGEINLFDVLKIRRYIANSTKWNLTNDEKNRADVEEDGRINLQDVLKLRRYVAASSNENIRTKHQDWIW